MWSSWTQFSDCSKDCDGGIKTRNRVCQSENGQESQNIFCEGSFEGKEECNTHPCKLNAQIRNETKGTSTIT